MTLKIASLLGSRPHLEVKAIETWDRMNPAIRAMKDRVIYFGEKAATAPAIRTAKAAMVVHFADYSDACFSSSLSISVLSRTTAREVFI